GAIDADRRGQVWQLDRPADDRDVDDAEGGDDAPIGDRDELVARREALRRRDDRRHEDLAGPRALRAEDRFVLERGEVARLVVAGDVAVGQVDLLLDVLDRLLRRFARAHRYPSLALT